jgi:hypothetical protein
MMRSILLNAIFWVGAACVSAGFAEEAGSPRAARSVHLWWPAPKSDAFINEMTVEQTTRGSYFMACGFANGYFGMQELGDGKKIVLFSVWDPGNPQDLAAQKDNVPAEQRVEVLHADDGVKVERFGGEGTGGKSMWPFDWKIGETCRFCVRSQVEGIKSSFAGYFWLAAENRWKHLATFRTITGGKPLEGFYSFVEDFRRDGSSVNEVRRARFGNGWAHSLDGDWVSLSRAKLTADKTKLDNFNGGFADGGFFLATGGDTKNTAKLNTLFVREPVALPKGVLAPSWSGVARDAGGNPLAKVSVDTSATPDLSDWGVKAGELCAEWYGKIHALLPSESHVPRTSVKLVFDPQMKGVAHAAGDTITIAATYVRQHRDDFGMVAHELTQVVQSYPKGDPCWLVEGIADYIRLVHYEPQAPRPKIDPDKASYKDAYKTTAMFLEWIEKTHGAGLVVKLNAALRKGAYREDLFKDITGKALDELWAEFVQSLKAKP